MLRSIDIQLSYPTEPDWAKVPVDILYQLVEEYFIEPNCATSALLELSERQDQKTSNYCSWVLEEEKTDKWLKQAAEEILKEKNL